MTQRKAVFVGCRLIAIYLVVDAIAQLGSGLISIASLSMMGGGRGGMPMPFSAYQPLIYQAIIRGGMALLLWSAAHRLSRIAADPENADENDFQS